MLRAERFDYFADHALATTTVDITSISAQPARLADIFALVERQTNFEFVYFPTQLPLKDQIAIESGKNITLARLFYSISNLTGLVFTRHNLKVTVRLSQTGDEIANQVPHSDRPCELFTAHLEHRKGPFSTATIITANRNGIYTYARAKRPLTVRL